MKPGAYNIELYRGDDWAMRVQVKNGDGQPVDLTGWAAQAQVRHDRNTTDITHTFTTTVAPDGITLTVTPADFATLTPGEWDLETVDPDGLVRTLLSGAVRIHRDVTR